jgi:PAS domain S-box-containing protein
MEKGRENAHTVAMPDAAHAAAAVYCNPLAVITLSPELEVTEWNPAASRLLALDVSQAAGYSAADLVAPEHTAHLKESAARCRDSGEHCAINLRLRDTCGQDLNTTTTLAPVISEGEFQGLVLVIQQRETELSQQPVADEAFSQSIIDHSPVGISVRDVNGQLLMCNRAWRAIWAIPEDEIQADMETPRQKLTFNQRDDYLGSYRDEVRRVYEEGGSFHLPARRLSARRAGSARWIEQFFYSLRDGTGTPGRVVILTMDVSKRRIAETALADSEIRYRELVDNMSEGLLVSDPEHRVVFANPAADRIFGVESGQLAGRKLTDFVPAEQMEYVEEVIQRRGDKPERYQISIIDARGDKRTLRISALTRYGPRGDAAEYLSLISDVTEHEALQEQLLQSQKMEALGSLAGKIAHDFNNLLVAIQGYAELLAEDVAAGSPAAENVRDLTNVTRRARDLVQQILAFSRRGSRKRRNIRLAAVVEEVVKLGRNTFPDGVEIRANIKDDAGLVLADESQLHQVLLNLCTNAVHAMPRGGQLLLTLQPIIIDTELATAQLQLQPGEYLQLSIADTGQGIEPEVVPRIFEPLFTTKEKGIGTGLGLAVVHGIITNLGGGISVDSQPGQGSTFNLFIPRTESSAEASGGQADTGASGHILVVDDEPALSMLLTHQLHRMGYKVTPLTSPADALALFRSEPDSYDLVVTDMIMPQLNGDRLAEALWKIRPGLPVILLTGYSKSFSRDQALQRGFAGFLAKPVTAHELQQAIAAALRSPVGQQAGSAGGQAPT